MDDFSIWLLDEVNKRGWIPAELAKRAGVNTGTLSNVLSGSRRPGPDFCRAIAKALNEPEEKIFRFAGLLSPLPNSEDSTLHELIELAKNLSTGQRKEALRYLRYLYQTGQQDE